MFCQLWRSLTATTYLLVLKLAVALSYAAGFNAMLFLPLHGVRAQSPSPLPVDSGDSGAAVTVESVISPGQLAANITLEKALRKNAQTRAAASKTQPVQQAAAAGGSSDVKDTSS